MLVNRLPRRPWPLAPHWVSVATEELFYEKLSSEELWEFPREAVGLSFFCEKDLSFSEAAAVSIWIAGLQ